MWETIRGYLTFTRKERLGVLFLLGLISALFILPYFFGPSIGDPDPGVYEKLKEGIRKFEARGNDSSLTAVRHDRYQDQRSSAMETYSVNTGMTERIEMFNFDPNGLSAKGWERLGLSGRLIKTILHYIEQGGRFRKAEDLRKLYGLSSADYERLLPFVRITPVQSDHRPHGGFDERTGYRRQTIKNADTMYLRTDLKASPARTLPYAAKKLQRTDINLADSSDWARLPGIGEKLASRIVRFREKLGGFYRIDQVGETFGLPDSSFQKIKSCLLCSSTPLHKIDLNSATKEELQTHPYIRWQLAKIIFEYRRQHGGFHSVDELLQLARMDSLNFEKLKPYLVVNP